MYLEFSAVLRSCISLISLSRRWLVYGQKVVPVSTNAHPVLSLIMSTADPPGSTDIPRLDGFIRKTTFNGRETSHTINSKDVIEIQGPSVGKSHLLMYFIMTCILPVAHLGISLSGWDKSAILIDLDHTFDVRRFSHLLRNRIKVHIPNGDENLDLFVDLLLRKLHIFRPESSVQFAVTATNIPNYHSSNMPKDEIGLVAVDSLSSFYWQDRFLGEQPRDDKQSGIEKALNSLEQIRQSHGSVIAYTNWGLSSALNNPQNNTPFYLQHVPQLHSPFGEESQISYPILPITYHMTLRTVAVPKVSPDTLAARLMEDHRMYDQVVEVLVRAVGFDEQVGSFMFKVTSDEVHFSGRR
jgi:DNA-repair protein XRCC2